MTATKTMVFNGINEDGPTFVSCQKCGCGQSSAFRQAKENLQTDFNSLVQFRCPSGLHTYELYVAFHKFPDGSVRYCIKRSDGSPIPSDWWVNL